MYIYTNIGIYEGSMGTSASSANGSTTTPSLSKSSSFSSYRKGKGTGRKWHYAPPRALDRYYKPSSMNSDEVCAYLDRKNSGLDYFESDEYIELRDLLDEDDEGRQVFIEFSKIISTYKFNLTKVWIDLHEYHTIKSPAKRFQVLEKIKGEFFDPVLKEKDDQNKKITKDLTENSNVGVDTTAHGSDSVATSEIVPVDVQQWIFANIEDINQERKSFTLSEKQKYEVGQVLKPEESMNASVSSAETDQELEKAPRVNLFLDLQAIVFRDLVDLMRKFKKSQHFKEYCRLKKVSYNKILPDDFKYMEILGKGGFGKVVHVMKKSTGQHYAMKIQAKDRLLDTWGDALCNLEIERDVLVAHNSFPFIVSLRYAFQDDKYAFLALDLIRGGSLRQLIETSPGFRLEKQQVRLYVAEIVLALECLHEHEIIYRDLKPANVLLTATGHIRLADMGLAGFFYQSKYYDESAVETQNPRELLKRKKNLGSHDTDCGTPLYRPPEMIKKEKYGPGVDWFQLGVFTYECLYGHLPFEPKRKIEDAETPFSPTRQDEMNALKCKLKLPEYEDDRTISFIKGLLELDCKKRLGADEFIKTSPLEDFNTAAAKIPVINGSATEPANVNVETHAEDKEGEEVDVVFIDDYEFPRVGMSLRNHPFFWALEGATATHVDWEKVATQVKYKVGIYLFTMCYVYFFCMILVAIQSCIYTCRAGIEDDSQVSQFCSTETRFQETSKSPERYKTEQRRVGHKT
mmetsp:Transcript_30085/g.37089  ORF Transcript_30085/g.37089 Transcript_30085/m.37089 type:complete len:744 (+) Transcript_30085:240-2471(+)